MATNANVSCSLTNHTLTPRAVNSRTSRRKSSRFTGQAIHGVHDHGVPVAHEAELRRQPRPSHVLARGMLVLVQAADADIGDSLPTLTATPDLDVSGCTLDLARRVSNNQRLDPILTHPSRGS